LKHHEGEDIVEKVEIEAMHKRGEEETRKGKNLKGRRN